MKHLVTTIAIWGQMAGVEMLRKGLSYVEEQWNLLLQRNTWLVKF